jgi:hypothetical protein
MSGRAPPFGPRATSTTVADQPRDGRWVDCCRGTVCGVGSVSGSGWHAVLSLCRAGWASCWTAWASCWTAWASAGPGGRTAGPRGRPEQSSAGPCSTFQSRSPRRAALAFSRCAFACRTSPRWLPASYRTDPRHGSLSNGDAQVRIVPVRAGPCHAASFPFALAPSCRVVPVSTPRLRRLAGCARNLQACRPCRLLLAVLRASLLRVLSSVCSPALCRVGNVCAASGIPCRVGRAAWVVLRGSCCVGRAAWSAPDHVSGQRQRRRVSTAVSHSLCRRPSSGIRSAMSTMVGARWFVPGAPCPVPRAPCPVPRAPCPVVRGPCAWSVVVVCWRGCGASWPGGVRWLGAVRMCRRGARSAGVGAFSRGGCQRGGERMGWCAGGA